MASPGCRRRQHKGRTSTNPALNRYGRSRSALYRADMAMGNPAQWSFHALRAHPGLGSAHLSTRATWMLLDGGAVMAAKGPAMLVGLMTGLLGAVHYVCLGSRADGRRPFPQSLLMMQWTAPIRRHLGAKMVVLMNHREIGAAHERRYHNWS